MTKIRSFTDITAWKKAHELSLLVYRITNHFPRSERYSLVDQIRRASVSVTSNIAEGFAMPSKKKKVYFYFLASGSLTEVKSQLLLARDLGFLEKDDFREIALVANNAHKLLNALIKSTKHNDFQYSNL